VTEFYPFPLSDYVTSTHRHHDSSYHLDDLDITSTYSLIPYRVDNPPIHNNSKSFRLHVGRVSRELDLKEGQSVMSATATHSHHVTL